MESLILVGSMPRTFVILSFLNTATWNKSDMWFLQTFVSQTYNQRKKPKWKRTFPNEGTKVFAWESKRLLNLIRMLGDSHVGTLYPWGLNSSSNIWKICHFASIAKKHGPVYNHAALLRPLNLVCEKGDSNLKWRKLFSNKLSAMHITASMSFRERRAHRTVKNSMNRNCMSAHYWVPLQLQKRLRCQRTQCVYFQLPRDGSWLWCALWPRLSHQ